MRTFKKILIVLLVIAGAIYLYHSGTSLGTRIAVFFNGVVIYFLYQNPIKDSGELKVAWVY